MGLATKGFYTRGNKTTSQIASLVGMVSGDTVFDTSRKERLVYNGSRWISGNQITFITRGITPGSGNQLVGAASIFSDQDFSINSGISTTNDENIIGCIQGPLGTSYLIGASVVLQYRGAGLVANSAVAVTPGQYIDLSSTRGRANGSSSPSIGSFGVWMEPVAINISGFGMIQPIEI